MKRFPRTLLLSLVILLPQGYVVPQTRANDSSSEKRDERFWTRFENEFDKFLLNVTSGFSPGMKDDSLGTAVHDSSVELSWTNGQEPSSASNRRLNSHDRWEDDETIFVWHGARMPPPWLNESAVASNVLFRYNRVEGLFLGLGSKKRYFWDGQREFSPYGTIGYGFTSHRWRGNLGLSHQVAFPGSDVDHLFEAGLEGYSLTDSKDQWRIGLAENTAAAFLIHEDFRDYFGREGVTLHAAYLLRGDHLFAETRISYLIDQYESLSQRTDWSLFGGGKRFRPNPAIDDGRMRSLVALAGLSTPTKGSCGPDGWNLNATAEFADRSAFGGDFTFRQYVADFRRYQPVGDLQSINLRLRVGTGHGDIPRQRTFEIGGVGTLPAFPFKAYPGDSVGANRMILLNAEYLVNGDILRDLAFWPSWLMKHINLILLTDAGVVRSVAPTTWELRGFDGITWNEFRHDLGVGVANRQGTVRFAVVWRTDRAEAAKFYFRFSAPF